MPDYCNQCATDRALPVEAIKELSDLVTRDQSDSGLFADVECEDCGNTFVDYNGYCQSKDCLKRHGDY